MNTLEKVAETLFTTPHVTAAAVARILEMYEYEGKDSSGGAKQMAVRRMDRFKVQLWLDVDGKRIFVESIRPTLKAALTEAYQLAKQSVPLWVGAVTL